MFGQGFGDMFSHYRQQQQFDPPQWAGTLGEMLGHIGRQREFSRHQMRPQMPGPQPVRKLNDPPKMPGSPVQPMPQTQPMAPAIMGNPFMPISSQPITFGSMLSRQPIY